MIALGIDPDTKNTALALVKHTFGGAKVLWVGVASVKASLKVEERIVEMVSEINVAVHYAASAIFGTAQVDFVAVEGQDAYAGKNAHARPNDLIHLAQVAGIATALAHIRWGMTSTSLKMPRPAEWKGSVPKAIHQRRILSRVELTDELIGVPGAERMTKTQRGHTVDAIGLALWGLEQCGAGVRRARRYGS